MFKNKKLTITVDKKDPNAVDEPSNPKDFEDKTHIVRKSLEKFGVKVFAGVCIYVVLDTFRQVSVAQANNPTIPPS